MFAVEVEKGKVKKKKWRKGEKISLNVQHCFWGSEIVFKAGREDERGRIKKEKEKELLHHF